jgi:hypothetical protein
MIAVTDISTWDSRIVLVLVFMFFLPISLRFLMLILESARSDKPVINVEIYEPVTYQEIERAAMIKAAMGDSAARNWVTKNVFEKKAAQKQALPVKTPKTAQHIIDDAVSALVKLKMKKVEAQELVMSLAMNRKFDKTERLLVECLRKKN